MRSKNACRGRVSVRACACVCVWVSHLVEPLVEHGHGRVHRLVPLGVGEQIFRVQQQLVCDLFVRHRIRTKDVGVADEWVAGVRRCAQAGALRVKRGERGVAGDSRQLGANDLNVSLELDPAV